MFKKMIYVPMLAATIFLFCNMNWHQKPTTKTDLKTLLRLFKKKELPYQITYKDIEKEQKWEDPNDKESKKSNIIREYVPSANSRFATRSVHYVEPMQRIEIANQYHLLIYKHIFEHSESLIFGAVLDIKGEHILTRLMADKRGNWANFFTIDKDFNICSENRSWHIIDYNTGKKEVRISKDTVNLMALINEAVAAKTSKGARK